MTDDTFDSSGAGCTHHRPDTMDRDTWTHFVAYVTRERLGGNVISDMIDAFDADPGYWTDKGWSALRDHAWRE